MGFRIDLTFDAVEVQISGWDSLLLVRRRLAVPYGVITEVRTATRSDLERRVDHRRRGVGGHNGERAQGGKRLGVFQSRDVDGDQFWAVDSSSVDEAVIVIDANHDQFRRLVLLPPGREAFVDTLQTQLAK